MSATERHVPTACEAPKVRSATKRNYTTTGIIEVQTKCYFHTQLQDPTVSFQFLWSVVHETRTPFSSHPPRGLSPPKIYMYMYILKETRPGTPTPSKQVQCYIYWITCLCSCDSPERSEDTRRTETVATGSLHGVPLRQKTNGTL